MEFQSTHPHGVRLRVAKLQLEENGLSVTYREINGRLGLQLVQRRGEDLERLHREQRELIARVLAPTRP